MSLFPTRTSDRQAKKRRSWASRPTSVQNYRGLGFEPLEERRLLSMGNAVNLGVVPGVHVDGLTLDAGDQNWYQVQLLRPAALDLGLGFDPSQGVLNLQILDSQGNPITAGVESSAGDTAAVSLSSAGTYFIEVSGQTPATSNLYNLSADFQSASDGTVYYVNSGNMVNDCYTLAPGNDSNSGLLAAFAESQRAKCAGGL